MSRTRGSSSWVRANRSSGVSRVTNKFYEKVVDFVRRTIQAFEAPRRCSNFLEASMREMV
jgi:hypothetical protein